MRPGGECALKQRMLTADMIEHTVEHDTQSAIMGRLDQRIEIGLITEPFVYLEMIDRVVAMLGRSKDRTEQDAGGTDIDRVIQPPNKMVEAMHDAGASGRLALGADKAKRIDLPPDRMLDPVSNPPLRRTFTLQADRPLSRTAGQWRRRPAGPRSELGQSPASGSVP